MHSSRKAPLSIVLAPVTTPVPSRREQKLATVARLETRAERELRAYFAAGGSISASNGASPDVLAVLAAIPAHHRGVLGLHYRPRAWPDGVKRAFGVDAGVAIRLYLADHPALGPTPVLEQAAAERVAAIVAAEGTSNATLVGLSLRAEEHHDRALRSYVKELARREAQHA